MERRVCQVYFHLPSTRNLTVGLTSLFLLPGREDPREMDGSRGHRLPQVHICQRCLELWDCHVGSHVIWRETLLGYVQPRCEYQQHLVATHPHPKDPTGMAGRALLTVRPQLRASYPELELSRARDPETPLAPMFKLIKEPSVEM